MGVGIYDKPSGVVRGECRGGLGGAAAPNRPPSAPAGGGPSNRKRKAPVPAGRNTALSKDKLCSFFQRIPPAQAHPSAARRRRPKQQIKIGLRARRAQKSPLKGQARFHCPCRPPRRRPKQHQNKASVPAGHKSHLSKDKPGFIAPCRTPRRRPKQHKKESRRARRAQKPFLKGQACFIFFRTPVAHTLTSPRRRPKQHKNISFCPRRAHKLSLKGQTLLCFL